MWQIKIHPLVYQEDFKAIPSKDQIEILKTIQKKLSLHPEQYGQPLRREFARYWRLRVRDYRVIYRIIKEEVIVLVVKIGIRRDDLVYKEFFTRLKKIP